MNHRSLRLVTLPLLFLLAVAPTAAERGTFHFDPQRLSQAQKDFSEAVQELTTSGDQEYLTGAGRKNLEKKRKAYDDCLAKKGEPKCGDAFAAMAAAAALYMDRGFKAVERFEAHMNLPADLRYELGRLLYLHTEIPSDRTLESLEETLSLPAGGGLMTPQVDIAVDLLQTFARLTQQVYQGPGGYPALLSQIVSSLEAYRLFYGLSRRHFVQNVAIPDQAKHVLDGLGDSVEVLTQGDNAPLRGFPLPDLRSLGEHNSILQNGLRSLEPKR